MVKIAEIKSVRDRTMQLLFLYVNMRLSQIKTIFSSLRLQPYFLQSNYEVSLWTKDPTSTHSNG